jgi:hypothetical protein
MLHQSPGLCANCSSAVTGNFCQQCGQETVLHPPSAREFVHEFIGHYVALEGRLWKTLGLLLFRPGRLTLEYLAGRRVRYVQPLRIYLTLSLVLFAVMKYADEGTPHIKAGSAPAAAVHASSAGKAPGEQMEGISQLSAWIGSKNPAMGARVDKFFSQPYEEIGHQFGKAFFSYAPYAGFLLMPVFAFFLKLFYLGSGRRYGEHLLFALHTNAFACAAMSLLVVIPESLDFVKAVMAMWLAFYLPFAMRRVYGGSWLGVVARWIALMFLHLLSLAVAVGAALSLAILA